jgi:CheY-like chemotaxis protein
VANLDGALHRWTPAALLSALSHELRGPVGTIVLGTELLKQGGFGGAGTQKALEVIERGAHSLEQALEDLFDLAQMVGEGLKLERQPIDLSYLLSTVVERCRHLAQEKGVVLRASPGGPWPLVRADVPRLGRALASLLEHAVKVTPPAGTVTLEVHGEGSGLRLRIAHGGTRPLSGDPLKELLGEGGARGAGLGVAMARVLVALHGGTVHSSPEGGDVVMLIQVPYEGPAGGSLLPEGLRVLLVDDVDDAREALRLLLERWGAVVCAVASVPEALRQLPEFRPDVVVSDIDMPGADGYDLMRRLRALPPEQGGAVPAAALTAFASDEDRRRALAAGYQEHLAKPLEPERLRRVLGALGRRS